MTLNEWLKRTRTTGTELGLAIGVSRQAISRYRKGRVPRPALIRKIETATGGAVTADDLLPPSERRLEAAE